MNFDPENVVEVRYNEVCNIGTNVVTDAYCRQLNIRKGKKFP
jgi:hypothetical protein